MGDPPNVLTLQGSLGPSLGNLRKSLNAVLSFLLVAVVIYFLVVLPVNRLRDRLNDLLYGAQDFALIGTKKS